MPGQTVLNLGLAGSTLNGQLGSSTSADSNDPKYLEWAGTNYIYFPGLVSNYVYVPDAAALDITGDIDIRVRVAMDDWTPAADGALVSKSLVTSQMSYELHIVATTGVLRFLGSSAGSSYDIDQSSSVAPTATDGSDIWVRVTVDVNNGASGHDVKFYTSNDGVTWVQLGTTKTGASAKTLFAGTASLISGVRGNDSAPISGKLYRVQVYNGIDGTQVLDIDTSRITSGANTTFTARTGQTVTIARRTAGRKTVAVTSSVWLFGTDDWISVADSEWMDFTATESFTAVAVARQWATPVNFGRFFSKSAATGAGWQYLNSGTSFVDSGEISDGTNTGARSSTTTWAASDLIVVGIIVDRSTNTMANHKNGTVSATTSISTVGDLSNAQEFRINGVAGVGTSYDNEILAFALFPRVLTATELAQITTYYQSRWP